MRTDVVTPRPRRTATYRARKVHRYLGLFIGIQFLLWTLGGLYFSWVSLDAVHGDHLHRPPAQVPVGAALVSPSVAIRAVASDASGAPLDSVIGVEMVNLLGVPTYRISYRGGGAGARREARLVDASTGAPRPAVSRDEAIRMATTAYAGTSPVASVEYLTAADVGRHHEYREQPLPAWAVRFADGEGATAYVAAELGEVRRIRNTRWRTFDFLWMLHTMDYRGRDDFNNVVLRAFSVLGLLTVLSGFTVFALTSPAIRRRRRTPATA